MGSEPERLTDASLLDVLDELRKREPIFHRPELGTKRSDFERMTAPEFWEVGASGRRYSREYVLSLLEERYAREHSDVWDTSEFCCQRLAGDTYLLTYTLVQNKERKTRRTTIWRQTGQGWQILFHQGTVVQQ